MKTNHFSHLLFDLDGTLTDPKEGITKSIQYALHQMEREAPPTEALVQFIGPPLARSFTQMLGSSDPKLIQEAVTHYRRRYVEFGLLENKVYPDVIPTLQVLQSMVTKLLVATSKPRVYALEILRHFELLPFFAAVYGSELDGRLSDKGELLAHSQLVENFNPARALMIGDREHDILGARANRMKSAAVFYGYGSREELAGAQPDFYLEHLRELPVLLRNLSS